MTSQPCYKRAYTSFIAANKAAKLTRREREDIVRPYLCGDCGLWHNGYSEDLERARISRRDKAFRRAGKRIDENEDFG